MDSLIEFSLNTPNNFDNNILNKKILSLFKNNKMYGGGEYYDNADCFTLIIGVIILIIGFVLCWYKNDWIEIKADIKNISCINNNNSNTLIKQNDCNVAITYTFNSIQYSKIITMSKSDIPTNNYIQIYCLETNPNVMRLYNFNYSVIGIILILIGAFILVSSISCSKINLTTSNVLDTE
jgi:hypothetical protein